jgi:uncharacterized protein (TIGR03032 family)
MTDRKADWERDARLWRDPAQAMSLVKEAADIDSRLLASRSSGGFWDLLQALRITLLVSREYEHVVMALTVRNGRPYPTFMPLPHPSGIAIDRTRGDVFIASTRNPNQIFTFRALAGLQVRADRPRATSADKLLMPVASQFLPGSLYIHDLATIKGALYANAVGQNAVVRLDGDGYTRVWWPRAIERRNVPDFSRNHIQLNSIAAGATLEQSFFSASSEHIGTRRPGQRNYPVDGRGVIFSARSREPIVRGLTRPHSARLWRRRLWVDNSGHGEVGVADDGKFLAVAKLPGWTRGLAFRGGYAFVGVSRIIPRFGAYAPGVDARKSVCGVFVVELKSGKVVASLLWPMGNQIFAVDWLPAERASGFPYPATGQRNRSRLESLFYGYDPG